VRLGLDRPLFDKCLQGGGARERVKADLDEAIDRRLRGTPSYFLDGQKHPGLIPKPVLEKALEQDRDYWPAYDVAAAVYLRRGLREIREPGRFPWSPLVLGVTFCLHGSAGLLLPTLLLRRDRSLWLRGALFLLPVALVFGALFLVTWGGEAPAAGPERYGTFLGAMDQGPLLPLTLTPVNVLHRYAVLDPDHLLGVANLLVLAAPVGLLLLLTGPWPRRDARFRFVLVAGAFLALFPLLWNVSYPLRRDWDLFSPVGVPLAVLGALALAVRGVDRAASARFIPWSASRRAM